MHIKLTAYFFLYCMYQAETVKDPDYGTKTDAQPEVKHFYDLI